MRDSVPPLLTPGRRSPPDVAQMTGRPPAAAPAPLASEDHPLFAHAFRQHYPDLVAFVRRHVPSDADAADIAQEAYLRVLRYRHEKDLTGLRMLVFRIALNLIGMRARTARTHRWSEHVPLEADMPLAAATPSQDRHVAGEQQLVCLMAALKKLPRKGREALLLRRFEGLSVQEVALRMNLSTKAVEMQVARAILALQKSMGREAS